MFFLYWAAFLAAAFIIMWSWSWVDSQPRSHRARILHCCLRVLCLLSLPAFLFGMVYEIFS